jgi:hypothetical protein
MVITCLKALYWLLAAVFLFSLPGITILMVALYLFYSFVMLFFEKDATGAVADGPDDGQATMEKSVVMPSPEEQERAAAAYAAEFEEIERKLNAQSRLR